MIIFCKKNFCPFISAVLWSEAYICWSFVKTFVDIITHIYDMKITTDFFLKLYNILWILLQNLSLKINHIIFWKETKNVLFFNKWLRLKKVMSYLLWMPIKLKLLDTKHYTVIWPLSTQIRFSFLFMDNM